MLGVGSSFIFRVGHLTHTWSLKTKEDGISIGKEAKTVKKFDESWDCKKSRLINILQLGISKQASLGEKVQLTNAIIRVFQ